MIATAFVWRGGDDQTAHAHLPGQLRTACGERIVQERLAWPSLRRCMACSLLVGEQRLRRTKREVMPTR